MQHIWFNTDHESNIQVCNQTWPCFTPVTDLSSRPGPTQRIRKWKDSKWQSVDLAACHLLGLRVRATIWTPYCFIYCRRWRYTIRNSVYCSLFFSTWSGFFFHCSGARTFDERRRLFFLPFLCEPFGWYRLELVATDSTATWRKWMKKVVSLC